MAIASSLFSPKSLLERFRSPVFIASALSLGAHGVLFAAMPILSASEDVRDQEESVPVVALSAEESQRLPSAVRNSGSNSFFANDPLVTQEGDALLPVPGIPPYGDLTGLNSGFNDPLQTAPPPLWGNPVDIFQDSLPVIPDQTSIVFPPSNPSTSFGSAPFDLQLNESGTFGDGANLDPALEVDNNVNGLDVNGLDDETDGAIAPDDQPLINGESETDGSSLESPLVSPDGGTTVDNAFGEPVDPDALAAVAPGTTSAGNESDPLGSDDGSGTTAPPTLAGDDPALLALRAEQQRLRTGYVNNGTGAAELADLAEGISGVAASQAVELKTRQDLVAQYPDPRFRCPQDALAAVFSVVISSDGSILEPQQIQSSQYPALDAAALDTATAFAEEQTEPGVYPLSIEFQDDAGKCGVV